MTKSKIKRDIRTVKKLKIWQLLLMLILMLFVTATLLRLDNIGMVQRLEAVQNADKEGNRDKLSARLHELKVYVFSHMNASTGRFYLVHQYERDARAILDKAGEEAAASNPNGNIYKKASEICDPRYSVYTAAYQSCILNELAKFPSADGGQHVSTVELPNTELYRLSYSSPIWTFSLTGLAILISLVLGCVIVARIILLGVLKLMLLRYKSE